MAENNWLRSWSNDLYLWYTEIADRDPALYATAEYFDLLKTTAVTASGRDKDQFHFTYKTSDWLALVQSGVEAGYGVVWSLRRDPPASRNRRRLHPTRHRRRQRPVCSEARP